MISTTAQTAQIEHESKGEYSFSQGLLQVREWGKNPILNFYGSDKEDILLMNTFPNVDNKLYDMANTMQDGTKVTKVYTITSKPLYNVLIVTFHK